MAQRDPLTVLGSKLGRRRISQGHKYKRGERLTRSARTSPPSRGSYFVFQDAMSRRFHIPLALSILATISTGKARTSVNGAARMASETWSKSSAECVFGTTTDLTLILESWREHEKKFRIFPRLTNNLHYILFEEWCGDVIDTDRDVG